jgi:hypothetical protein
MILILLFRPQGIFGQKERISWDYLQSSYSQFC